MCTVERERERGRLETDCKYALCVVMDSWRCLKDKTATGVQGQDSNWCRRTRQQLVSKDKTATGVQGQDSNWCLKDKTATGVQGQDSNWCPRTRQQLYLKDKTATGVQGQDSNWCPRTRQQLVSKDKTATGAQGQDTYSAAGHCRGRLSLSHSSFVTMFCCEKAASGDGAFASVYNICSSYV